MDNEFGYFSKDVAIELDITTSSLRRWSIELEKEGYLFQRNDKGQRIYFERDFKAFRELKKLLSNSVPFTDAIKAVTAIDFDKQNAEKTPSVYSETMRLSKHELETIIKKAIEEEREIMLAAFQEKLSETIEARDKMLMSQIEKSQEEKNKLLETEAQDKKTWWSKMFQR